MPLSVPSLGVTSTLTTSPGSPLPATERSKVSVRRCWCRSLVRAVDLPHVGQGDRVAVGIARWWRWRSGSRWCPGWPGRQGDRGRRARVLATVTGLEVSGAL